MSEEPARYDYDDLEPPHPAVAAWVERLQPIVGDWVAREDLLLVIDELLYCIQRDLANGRPVDLRTGRLVCDGEVVEWEPSE